MSFLPFVSVIVPIYNGEADLPPLLACLQAQTYANFECLLVDNNSNDRTAELLNEIEDPRLRSLKQSEIQSSYAARNLGIQNAKGEILAFTDADCRPEPNWLEDLIQPFCDPAVGLVAGEIKALPGNTLLEQYADRQETLSQKHTLNHPFCAYGQTANLAIRAAAFKEVGLFRPYLTTGGDADICWRILRETAWQLRFAETAIVRHRHRTTFSELQSQWRRYGRSNRYLHDLHGIDLMREPQFGEYRYRLLRWILKEFPIATLNLIKGKAAFVDLINTPIGLFCLHARAQGQRQATLSPQAHTIEPLIQQPQNSLN
ncbi:glycosyltransferase [Leptolyngbya boryana CZ1]|jgi:glycosyltransferase involved in cell wall biosynthesis|uniref:Family 2 glycosyl transferase n=2 Tax=Leptolyngbya boryana TaxID=1184 RepID=A0A1Z4JMC4_LEPBY|nr:MULTISPECIES: glycosyltransferase [Leptolyngbya]BAY57891.1 family 2 glycosyl transferase [Leptolyngbya boryana NIES-2135]MBD1854540.1 glycosyltransferase [Leptolyngbya sp. FACHB-1624]MBD2367337.1 glycosyltransferase [Leptolyngbya sp. FACHB-161]MBD2373861.1 glycosyltransferase [Leptolyngbya sp. FACHB-238]MBD2398339.1 glycosyltransferase [Leptolyngbya sp. FACHB-239]